MFFYEDLELYKKKEFKSSYYVISAWNIIEHDLLFLFGIIESANLTITIDYDKIYLTATSQFQQILKKVYDFTIDHSLTLCEDFTTEIQLNLNKSRSFKSLNFKKSNFYFSTSNKSDEGIVEFELDFTCDIKHFKKLKLYLLPKVAREIQFSICRNIFYLDIDDFNAIQSEIHSEFEAIQTMKEISNNSIEDCIYVCIENNCVNSYNKEILENLVEKIKD